VSNKISVVSFITISEKRSNKNREVVSDEGAVLLSRNPLLSELGNLDPRQTFVATEEFRFFKSRNKKTVFQRSYVNPIGQIIWKECDKVFLVEQGGDE
jgi:hypothetical protein